MPTLQNLQFKTSSTIRAKSTTGEGLAKLVSTALGAYGTVKKIDEQNKEKERILKNRAKEENLDEDSLLFIEQKAGLEEYKNNNNYYGSKGDKQEGLINQYLLENNYEYTTDKYKSMASGYMESQISKTKIVQQKDFENEIKNETIPTIVKNSNVMTEEDIDNVSIGLSNNGVSNAKKLILNGIYTQSYNNLIENKDYYIANNMDKDDILKSDDYKAFGYIKDSSMNKNTTEFSNTLNSIDKAVKTNRYNSVVDKTVKTMSKGIDFNKSKVYNEAKEHKNISELQFTKDIRKSSEDYIDSLALSKKPALISQAVELSNQFGYPIKVMDKAMTNFSNTSMLNTSKAIESYEAIKNGIKAGYTFSKTDTNSFIEFGYALDTLGFDQNKEINTQADMEDRNTKFQNAIEIINNKSKNSLKAVNRTDTVKYLKDNDIDGIDEDNPVDVDRFHKAYRDFSTYYPRDIAVGMAKAKLSISKTVEYDGKKIDMSGTSITTNEQMKQFMDFKKQDYPNVEIGGIRKVGNMFVISDEDGTPVTIEPMNENQIDKYLETKNKIAKEKKLILDQKAKKEKELKNKSKEIYSYIKKNPEEFYSQASGLAYISVLGQKIKAMSTLGQSITISGLSSLSDIKDFIVDTLTTEKISIKKDIVLTSEDIKNTKKLYKLMDEDEKKALLNTMTEDEIRHSLIMSPSDISETLLKEIKQRE